MKGIQQGFHQAMSQARADLRAGKIDPEGFNKRIAEIREQFSHFAVEPLQDIPPEVKDVLLGLHEALKGYSLWTDHDASQNKRGHIGEVEAFGDSWQFGAEGRRRNIEQDAGFRKAAYSFEQKAEASGLQLAIARVLGLVTGELSSGVTQVERIPDNVLPYYGFVREQHEGTAMAAYHPSESGRFESTVSRFVVQKPENVYRYLEIYAPALLLPKNEMLVLQWWNTTFGPIPETAPAYTNPSTLGAGESPTPPSGPENPAAS